MKFGFVFPGTIVPGGDAPAAVEFAQLVESAGWDGFFVWEPVWGVDAWVTLAAAAMLTKSIRLGTMISPISRMRPWKLAGEAATLDNLSNGRVIISVGLGAVNTGFDEFGEEKDRKTRAELLDEGLDIIIGLWNGQPFNYSGKHYQVKEIEFHPSPPPVQKPRIPIWVVGAWPHKKSMRRPLKYDGLLPAKMNEDGSFADVTPADIRVIKSFIDENRSQSPPFDIVVEGTTPGDDPEKTADTVRPFASAGATWWIEAMWTPRDLDAVRVRAEQGPPRLE
ncbi:MAG: LLM class flavin-dependent oxidoreductase [Candidatus Odinarchaeota archaeon]